jgi:hypothetical protein
MPYDDDGFTRYYAELLDGRYDCVDRIVLRAYCPVMNNPGGFRMWWRQLTGSDATLDDNHLMRLAGRFSRRLRAWGGRHGVPVIDCPRGTRMHEFAEQQRPSDPDFVGLFLVLVARQPASVWRVRRYGNGAIDLSRKTPPAVNYYFFHLMDPQFGHVTIGVCGHPPFNAMIFLNGHEFVERQALRRNVAVTKQGNCFVDMADAPALQGIADALSRGGGAVGRLKEVAERWLYTSCLCFALDEEERRRSGMRYAYSLHQLEYSRNLLFRQGSALDAAFEGFIDRTRALLDLRKVATIFGYRNRPARRRNPSDAHRPRFDLTVETLEYDLTVFKVHYGSLSLKVYSKGERVLRIEATALNAKVFNLGVQLEAFPVMVEKLRAMVVRFLDALRCADQVFFDAGVLDGLAEPTERGARRIAGVDLNKTRMRTAAVALLDLTGQPQGFTLGDLAGQVRRLGGRTLCGYTTRQAAYDLSKIRAKGYAERIERTRRHRPVLPAFQQIAALLIVREKLLKPLASGFAPGRAANAPNDPAPIDEHYRNLRHHLQNALNALGLAA